MDLEPDIGWLVTCVDWSLVVEDLEEGFFIRTTNLYIAKLMKVIKIFLKIDSPNIFKASKMAVDLEERLVFIKHNASYRCFPCLSSIMGPR